MFKVLTAEEMLVQPFKPVAFYNRSMDFLYVLERDCSVTQEYVRGSTVELLRDNGPDGQLVGVVINGYSRMARWDTCDSVIAQFPAWFRFLYRLIKKHRDKALMREMKKLGFPV